MTGLETNMAHINNDEKTKYKEPKYIDLRTLAWRSQFV